MRFNNDAYNKIFPRQTKVVDDVPPEDRMVEEVQVKTEDQKEVVVEPEEVDDGISGIDEPTSE